MFDEAIPCGRDIHLACSYTDQRFCHHTLNNSPRPLGLGVYGGKSGLSKATCYFCKWLIAWVISPCHSSLSHWPMACSLSCLPQVRHSLAWAEASPDPGDILLAWLSGQCDVWASGLPAAADKTSCDTAVLPSKSLICCMTHSSIAYSTLLCILNAISIVYLYTKHALIFKLLTAPHFAVIQFVFRWYIFWFLLLNTFFI